MASVGRPASWAAGWWASNESSRPASAIGAVKAEEVLARGQARPESDADDGATDSARGAGAGVSWLGSGTVSGGAGEGASDVGRVEPEGHTQSQEGDEADDGDGDAAGGGGAKSSGSNKKKGKGAGGSQQNMFT